MCSAQNVSAELEKSFKKSEIEILSSTKVVGTKDLGNRVEITVEEEGSVCFEVLYYVIDTTSIIN